MERAFSPRSNYELRLSAAPQRTMKLKVMMIWSSMGVALLP
jgi:hypothetical protein